MKTPSRFAAYAASMLVMGNAPQVAAQLEAATEPSTLQEKQTPETAQRRLRDAWQGWLETPRPRLTSAEEWRTHVLPQILPADELDALFRSAPAWVEPEIIHSVDGVLSVTLTAAYAQHSIGGESVRLRSYNEKLAGPTLRCRPGDLLRIQLINRLPTEPRSRHLFNVTNLHTHGLHVSPAGNSDNLQLQVAPQSSQDYEILIPKDHACGTFWYHAQPAGSAALQVGSGMSGALIIEGGMDKSRELHNAAERVFQFQQIPFVKPAKPATGASEAGVVEPELIDQHFGPDAWDKLGRYTTINGVRLPLIRMRPGSVERWRFIHAGMSEVIEPALFLQERSRADAPDKLLLAAIAVDGLPLGRMVPREQLELWPGTRSDVLVKAPDEAAGAKYILYDRRVVRDVDLDREERHYLALVSIEGERSEGRLPEKDSLRAFRPASIPTDTLCGRQFVSYGVADDGNAIQFQHRLHAEAGAQAWLGEALEWTLTARNTATMGSPLPHIFHLQTHPLEIYSILDERNEEQLELDPASGRPIPLWRDTIVLRENWKITARMRLEDFAGVSLHYCQSLNHADLGMVEPLAVRKPSSQAPAAGHGMSDVAGGLLEAPVRAYDAPLWALQDAQGVVRRLDALLDGPALLVFFEGFSCLRCNEQIQSLIRLHDQFQKQGTRIIAVSTDTVESLRDTLEGIECPFCIVADPECRAFRQWSCHTGEGPLHGVFLVDARRSVRWQAISTTPYTGLERLLSEAAKLHPQTSPAAATR